MPNYTSIRSLLSRFIISLYSSAIRLFAYLSGEHEAIHNGLWMTYPTYSAGIGACGKQIPGLEDIFDRFVQGKAHCIVSLFMKGGTLNGPNRNRTLGSRSSS